MQAINVGSITTAAKQSFCLMRIAVGMLISVYFAQKIEEPYGKGGN
jgi:hypothetical protein